MYRRPARDRNYEFWGDQTFFGENPPQAAIISWYLKQDVGKVALKITNAAGATVREIAGDVLAKSNTAGIQSACWDLRIQPALAPETPPRGGGAGRGGGTQAVQPQQEERVDPFGAGCGGGGGGGFGGFGGGGTAEPCSPLPFID